MKKNLFLPIEFKYREFLSKILLASYAVKLGFRVYIGSSDSIFRLVNTKRQTGGIFFFKGGMELKSIVKLKKKCDHFVILDEELGTEEKHFAKVARRRIWPGTEKLIDRYFVIGKYGYDASRDMFPEMINNIRCTGWPRVDLWRKENDFLFRKKTELIKKKYGRFILFSSDFGYNSIKIINDRLEVVKKSEWQSLRNEYSVRKTTSYEIFKEFNKFLEMLYKYDGIEEAPLIIVRPHPAEDINAWYEFSKKVSNIKVIYEGEISPWINASSGVLHRGCSAAIQAHMRGLPIGHFVSENAKADETPYKISKHLFTVHDVIEFCKTSVQNKNINSIKYHDQFNKMIYVKENELASELIIKDLSNLDTNLEDNCDKSFINVLIDLKINFKAYIKKILKLLSLIDENLGVVSLSRKIPGGITENEVQEFLNLIDSNNKFKVKKIFKDCIEIE